jgi:hypothetical protein
MTVHPSDWQDLTKDCGLDLHASFGDFRELLPALQTEFAAFDRDAAPAERDFRAGDGSWSSLTLINRDKQPLSAGLASPGIVFMPTVAALLERAQWTVLGAHILRQPPQGTLPWHYEDQAPYSPETRLLIPLHAPVGSRTLVSHEAIAYPEGMGWIADVNFPHQVENHSDSQRIILIMDVVSDNAVRRLFPLSMLKDVPCRLSLAQQCQGLMLQWREH